MNLFNFFKRFEAFLIYETSTVKKHLSLVFLALMIPGDIKFFFIFILILKLIKLSLSEKRIPILFSLPFSRSEIFIYSFLFGFSLVFAATSLGRALFDRGNSADILKYFVFYTFYFAATLTNFTKTRGTVFAMLFLTFDLISSFILPDFYRFFSQYSPIYQKNQPVAMIIALILLLISYLLFAFERRKNW